MAPVSSLYYHQVEQQHSSPAWISTAKPLTIPQSILLEERTMANNAIHNSKDIATEKTRMRGPLKLVYGPKDVLMHIVEGASTIAPTS